ncbi:hypothetical protein [Rhizobium anhuiense]|nr:hypothetical protein [Rhizobium anhuiense]
MATVTTKNIPIGSAAVTLPGIRRMWRDLNALVAEQGEIELSRLVRQEGHSLEEFEAYKQNARNNVFRILGTVEFENDVAIHDVDPEIVNIDPDGPLIRFIYMSHITPYQQSIGVKPEHAFEVILDFRQPPLLDASSVISAPTPNATKVAVSGSRDAWQAGVTQAVIRNIARRRPVRTWFHGSFIYDLFLVLIGLPLALYACWFFAPFVNGALSQAGPVVIGAAYLYIGFCAIWIYRILFSYAKWAFPLVEISEQRTKPLKHRALWWLIVATLGAKIFWDIADPLISIKSFLPAALR